MPTYITYIADREWTAIKFAGQTFMTCSTCLDRMSRTVILCIQNVAVSRMCEVPGVVSPLLSTGMHCIQIRQIKSNCSYMAS